MSKKNDVIINAANLHYGGGVQVASSFISDLLNEKVNYSIVVSSEVYANLERIVFDKTLLQRLIVTNLFGLKRLTKEQKAIFEGYKLCFTIFGPVYFRVNVSVHICGFAQPWIAYPRNEVYNMLSLKERLKTRIKFLVQKLYFRKYDKLVVEQKHIKRALIHQGFASSDIVVIPNAVSEVFSDANSWETVDVPPSLSTAFTIGFIGKNYLHKNLRILSDVSYILDTHFKVKVNFLFTLDEQEMIENDFSSKNNFYSLGKLKLTQCPNFYKAIDALIFPSLLECFSASPIEAKKMGKKIIASNRDFVTDLIDLNDVYLFEPTSAESIASAIVKALNSDVSLQEHCGGRDELDEYTSKTRTSRYIDLIEQYRNN